MTERRHPNDRARNASLDIAVAVKKFRRNADSLNLRGSLIDRHVTFGDIEVGQISQSRKHGPGVRPLARYLFLNVGDQHRQIWLPNDETCPELPLAIMTEEPLLERGWDKASTGLGVEPGDPSELLDQTEAALERSGLKGIHRMVGGMFLIRSLMFP